MENCPGLPELSAAGRFLAPEGRYFPDLLVEGVAEEQLVAAAIAELDRGATWVKVIADFPQVPSFTDLAPTYSTQAIAAVCQAVHARGARIAVHSTLPTAGELIDAGVDSIEHGTQLDAGMLERMAIRGTAWTPTTCALLAVLDDPSLPSDRRKGIEATRDRMKELLPLAVRLGVPVLAGSDGVGTIAREVALLAGLGLDPADALAAATVVPREVLGGDARRVDVVTYDEDPRDDPEVLTRPAAVVVNGVRLR